MFAKTDIGHPLTKGEGFSLGLGACTRILLAAPLTVARCGSPIAPGKEIKDTKMSYDVVIEIMGSCTDAALLRDVIEAAETDAAERDWYVAADDADIIEAIKVAVEEGGILTLMKSDTLGLFRETREACQNAGLHYVVSYGSSGEEGFSEGIFYRAGGEEFVIPLDVGNEVVPMRDLRASVEQGLDAVKEMIAEYDRKVLKDIDRSLAVPVGIVQELASEIAARP